MGVPPTVKASRSAVKAMYAPRGGLVKKIRRVLAFAAATVVMHEALHVFLLTSGGLPLTEIAECFHPPSSGSQPRGGVLGGDPKQIGRTRAESQQIVATRPLYCLQYSVLSKSSAKDLPR
jgi:hypothetical protein